MSFEINPKIELAETLDSSFYTDSEHFTQCVESVFVNSWQYVGDNTELLKQPENIFPVTILEKSMDEPVVLIKEGDAIRCTSNICTHRGFKIVHHPMKARKLTCGYHGRRFDLEGQFEFMPEFKEAEEFPRPCDHLNQLPIHRWKRFLFTGLSPKIDFARISQKLDERLGFLNMDQWRFAPEYSKTYAIKANWALYCDNYLEGFHIPFVHNDLGKIVDYGQYITHVEDHMVLQIGYGNRGDIAFELPDNHPDSGRLVTAYYYWLFPNFMLNVYKWGVQINIVKPISVDFCKVEFLYYIADEELWERQGKDDLAEKVEREDEFVVEAVQKGLKSRFYKNGRFSPKREKGVHYFHQLLSKYMRDFK
ncbi:Rieske 2Fe-2S domain-containing protein [Saprospiraceae bacterium]|nr:Rieske 2Fe-2S domain-containing protein [Saprospiraceae bacterium]